MDLSVNPLKSKARSFLKSVNPLGFNKAQYQNDISRHIEKSIRYLFHILKNPHNLRETDLYDKFNAQTLAAIIEDLLRDTKEKDEYRHEKYDFRTVELAKLFFYISTNYLNKSKVFQDDEFIADEVKRVANRFQMLSRSILEKEKHDGKISEKQEIKLKDKLEELKNHEYYKLTKKRSLLIKKAEKASDEEYKKIKREINELELTRRIADTNLKNQKDEIYKILDKKYDHLLGYFCPYGRLREFEYKDYPHKFSKTSKYSSSYR